MPNKIFKILGEEQIEIICMELELDEYDKEVISNIFTLWEAIHREEEVCASCDGGELRKKRFEILEENIEGNEKRQLILDAIYVMLEIYYGEISIVGRKN